MIEFMNLMITPILILGWFTFSCIVGALVFIVCLLIGEFIRAFRQSIRLYSIHRKVNNLSKFKISQWFRVFRSDLFSSYDTTIIGGIRIPRNPSEPMQGYDDD